MFAVGSFTSVEVPFEGDGVLHLQDERTNADVEEESADAVAQMGATERGGGEIFPHRQQNIRAAQIGQPLCRTLDEEENAHQHDRTHERSDQNH